ncbi:diguanylate cyclase/phosphodiesterase (GGDEF & EAL domains) with PAS/PAC sensor(s), partial [hydrothermal vent metagenome]
MKKTFSIKSVWYGLIALFTLLPIVLLLPLIMHRSHALMLENAVLIENLHIDRIKGEVQSETKRLISMLENKGDSMAYALGRGPDIDLLLELFEAILSRENSIHALFIIDMNVGLVAGMDRSHDTGRMRKILPPQQPHERTFDADSPRVAIASMGRNYIGSPAMHEGAWNFDIAVPIGPRESPTGILVASIIVEELWGDIGAKLTRPKVDTYVIDRRGALLSAPPPGAIYKQGDILTRFHIVRSLIISERHSHMGALGAYEGIKGVPVFGVGAQIDILNWAIISEIPEEMITGPIYRFLLIVIGLGVLFVIIFGGFGFWLANGMLVPIISMSKSFKKAEAGDYSRADTTSSITEINQLIAGFDHMIGNINRREISLRKSEERFRNIFKNSNDAIFMIETKMDKIVEVNPKACAMLGYSREELLSTPMSAIHPKEIKEIGDFVQKVYKEGSAWTDELTCRTKKGNFLPAEISASVTEIEGKTFMIAMVRDITERKHFEDTLQNIASGVSAETGEAFFQKLVLSLATLLDANYAFIDEFVDDDAARTLAFCAHGEILDNMTYYLEDTPCSNVAGQRTCFYPYDVQKRFPKDRMLADMGVESYIGKPLYGSAGHAIGLIAIMDDKPMKSAEHLESIMEIFTARAEAEIERMGADKALRESEEKFSKAFHSSPDSITITSLEGGRIIEANEGFERIFGFTREETLGKSTLDLGLWPDPEIRKRFTGLLEKNGTVTDFEVELKTRQGENIICILSAEPIELSQTPYLIATTRDITDRKKTEKKLKESELWLQSIYSSLEEAVIVATADRKLKNINKAGEKMFGYSFEELEDKSTSVLHVDHDHYMEFGRRIKKAFDKGEPADFEFELKRKNGEIFPTEHTVSLLKNNEGATMGIISSVRDITERKKAEEALWESYRLLERSQKVASLGSYALDVSSGTWSSSEVLDKIFGITDGGFTRNVEGWLAIIHPEHKEEMQNYFAGHVLAGRNKFDKEYRIVRRDDRRERWVHGLGELVLDEDQNPVKMIGTIQDITERVRAERELAMHRDHLEELVEARTNELTNVNKELESFAYSVSHDLRAPLRAIDGFSKALLEDYAAKLDKEGKNYLGRVRAATGRMALLIDDLLTLSRVTRTRMMSGQVDLSRLAHDVADDLRKECPECNVEFAIEEGLVAQG